MTGTEVLFMNSRQATEMFMRGVSYREIGRKFGVSKDVVSYWCRLNNLSRGSNKNSEADVARRIEEKTSGRIEYVSGYTTKEKPIVVRCTVCGGTFERTYHHITTHPNNCPCCVKSEREHKRERKRNEEESQRLSRKKLRALRLKEIKAETERKKAERIHKCPVCGTETDRPKYCCSDCARKADNKQRDHRRRMKIRARLIDNDITVEGLYRRDSGVCYLCGGRCNLEDYTVRDGAFVAGDWYPSIDHVVPLAKGGEHSWSNVRLAHRRCNILKSDKII